MWRVIVIEDHPAFRESLKVFITSIAGCILVGEAPCGVLAMEVVKKVPADLILLDLSLPRVSGLEVLREIKKSTTAKVLVVTLHTDPDVIKQALALGADGVVSKDQTREFFTKGLIETLESKQPFYITEQSHSEETHRYFS